MFSWWHNDCWDTGCDISDCTHKNNLPVNEARKTTHVRCIYGTELTSCDPFSRICYYIDKTGLENSLKMPVQKMQIQM